MNFGDLLNCIKDVTGYVDASRLQDRVLQRYKDALNHTVDEMSSACPELWNLIREDSLTLTNGTSVYTLNDWCKRPVAFWTVDSSAHKVYLKMPRTADRDGSRNSNLTMPANGPFEITLYPRTTTAALSGSSATATEGSSTIAALSGVTAAHVGRMIRLNGEDSDYKVTVNGSGTSVTVDKPIRARLSGTGVTGVGSNYSGVKWEIGPTGRFQIQTLPAANATITLYYRYEALPRRMVNTDEAPEIPVEYHHLIWKGALRLLAAKKEDLQGWQMYTQEYANALQEIKKAEMDDADNEEAVTYASELNGDEYGWRWRTPPGTYFRD